MLTSLVAAELAPVRALVTPTGAASHAARQHPICCAGVVHLTSSFRMADHNTSCLAQSNVADVIAFRVNKATCENINAANVGLAIL